MSQAAIDRCVAEQRRCFEYLESGDGSQSERKGCELGLHDWTIEEMLIREHAAKPLAIDLFCGLGGWTEGLLDQGYCVIGFDVERRPYPAQLVLQDVLTIHGSQFKDAALIVASPPCQAYSMMAMPFSRGKRIAAALRGQGEFPEGYKGARALEDLNACFNACFRIQREASEAAGRHIPMVVENVKGAAPWVGRAKWHYGSFYLYGDVPALMPFSKSVKVGGFSWSDHGRPDYVSKGFNVEAAKAIKNNGGSWFAEAHNTTSGKAQNPDGRNVDGIKAPGQKHGQEYAMTRLAKPDGIKGLQNTGAEPQGSTGKSSWFFKQRADPRDVRKQADGSWALPGGAVKIGGDWFSDPESTCRKHSSRSNARKQASAEIAKIPFPLAQHIAKVYKPE